MASPVGWGGLGRGLNEKGVGWTGLRKGWAVGDCWAALGGWWRGGRGASTKEKGSNLGL